MVTSIAAISMAIVMTMIAGIFLVQYIVKSLGYMGCMRKVGEATWKAWIPLFNDYTMYKIVDLKSFLIIFKIIYVIIAVIYMSFTFSYTSSITERVDNVISNANTSYSTKTKSDGTKVVTSVKSTSSYDDDDFAEEFGAGIIGIMIFGFLYSMFGIAVFIIRILFAINISKAYGLGGGTIAGMILIPQIFILIIGFGNSKYQGTYQPAVEKI